MQRGRLDPTALAAASTDKDDTSQVLCAKQGTVATVTEAVHMLFAPAGKAIGHTKHPVELLQSMH